MMMERAKTAPAPEPPTQADGDASKSEPTAQPAPAETASAEERVQDLERRLQGLGGESAAAAAAAPAAAPKQQQTGKNNPLLKRIQAAQERARLAEQKEKEEKAAAAAELTRQQKDEEEANAKAEEEARIAKAQSALRSVAGRALEDKQREILAQLEGKSPVAPTSPGVEVSPGVPIMKTMDPPPPSFDSMQFPPPREQSNVMMPGSEEMKGHGMNSRKLTQQSPGAQQAAPPSFDFVEQQLAAENVPPPPPAPTAPQISPSAPPAAAAGEDHLQGVLPVAPPLLPTGAQMDGAPPPSFEAFEQQQQAQPTDTAQPHEAVDDDLFAYDENGNPLSPEQKQALLDEQRRLYESIRSEKAANDAAIAEAQADAFDMRSSNAAAAAMDGGSHVARNQAMDAVGRNVEPSAAAAAAEGEEPAAEDARHDARRMVKIGNNQTVALHGQDRTKRAIKEGTAVLVQCINCQNWMQVTDTATLMFCPVCQVVSPVIQQTEVMTKEEAIQLTMDRKLAEKLQAEAYGDGEERKEEGEGRPAEEQGFFGKLFGTAEEAPSTSLAAAGTRPPHADTWWDKISSIVSYGVADDGPRERGDLGVSLPPGAPSTAQYPGERRGSPVAASSGSPARHEETRGLLAPVVDGHEESLPAGRVAESKPLFSCLADSMSSAAQALYSTGEGDGQGNVHGVDASSLLVTNAGRGVGDGAGSYEQLPDRE
ncbi:hypothetical protein ACHAXT_007541 [Thalassiosira profunda]